MDKIIKIVQERYGSPNPISRNGKVFAWDDYQIKWVINKLQEVDKKMEYYKQIYKDKCIARKEISENEIADIGLVLEKQNRMKDWRIEPTPNIKTFL